MIEIKETVPLAAYSNYQIGGPARYFCEPQNVSEIREAVLWAKKEKLPIFILGGGTNILFSEKGFGGLVLKPTCAEMLAEGATVRAGPSGRFIRAGAGAEMRELLNFAADRGLAGLEWAGGLPGTVGGAIRGNAGCFGGEIKDRVCEVTSMDISGAKPKLITRGRRECAFEYRTSIFKARDGKEIILEAMFALEPGDRSAIRNTIEEKIRYRRERHPMEYPNIGSMFKNVPLTQINADYTQINADTIRVYPRGSPRISVFTAPVKTDPFPLVPTAHLIAQAGLRGISCGGAMISPKHPNFIVNVLQAEPAHVRALLALAKREVKKKFRVALEEEVIVF